MQHLAWHDFDGAQGNVYRVDSDAGQLEFTLETVAELPSSGRAGGSFRLEFRGPRDPIMPQAIYRFHRGDEFAEIFVVPIGRDEKGTLYEALFN